MCASGSARPRRPESASHRVNSPARSGIYSLTHRVRWRMYVALFGLQLLCGLAQGPIFPVSSGVMETWFPTRRWALVQGLQSTGLQWAAAATVPLVAYLMNSFGWQRALLWPALPAAGVIAV